ncbi:MAG: cation transporter [Bacteroidota bacterium]|nr:cation transporter [Bacteroidota bacterium]|tara:strand:+ start:3383 stop:3769 length:387 start_codon:yes stop_codon:yes gene_type:complete
MKNLILLISIFVALSCQQNKKIETIVVKQEVSIVDPDISFGVRGNCGMCKTTIEKAALSVDGVEEASWSITSKILDVKTASNLDSIKIHEAVANSGYDTELVLAVDENYNNLPGCCQYNREMVITSKN